MKVAYDGYYQQENYFGNPYPELIQFFQQKKRGKLLDVGCGQGRDAISLARLGFQVIGIDNSAVGIDQLNQIAQKEDLPLVGKVIDFFDYDEYHSYEYILMNSLFHFGKKEIAKEKALIQKIIHQSKVETILIFCIQNKQKKVAVLNEILEKHGNNKNLFETDLQYEFIDSSSNHSSKTNYKIIAVSIQ